MNQCYYISGNAYGQLYYSFALFIVIMKAIKCVLVTLAVIKECAIDLSTVVAIVTLYNKTIAEITKYTLLVHSST